jgi:peptide chain release factor 1
MVESLEAVKARLTELTEKMSTQEVLSNPALYQSLAREAGRLGKIVSLYEEYERQQSRLKEAQEVLKSLDADEELRSLAKEEAEDAERKCEKTKQRIIELLYSDSEDERKKVILEIRAGTGGEEAALFAADLFRMYTRYFQRVGLKFEVMYEHPTDIGGFKEVVLSVEGKDVYRRLKNESGVHRVQRVPVTEASGRIHTSAATVAVLAEPEEVELEIPETDLRIERIKGGGPGGQSVNKTSSAVRVMHIPTGMIVYCQDERSQRQNLEKAMRVLRTRLYEKKRQEMDAAYGEKRRRLIGSGDRSEKIRTYNFPQNRVTDHRIKLTLYSLDRFLDGEIDEMIDALIRNDIEEKLKKANVSSDGSGLLK